MPDVTGAPATGDLKFDSVVFDGAGAASKPSATCAACQRRIDDVYYDVNGMTVCAGCRVVALSLAETPRGAGPLIKAGLFGLGAGIVGAMIYYAVIALANLEIGIVAILIGYMVGYAVKKGAGNRGGRRFQVLAVVLTYASVAMAYTPLVLKGAAEAGQKPKQAVAAGAVPGSEAPEAARKDHTSKPGAGALALAFVVLFGIIAALPVMVIFGSMPSGLISAAIIFFGMRRAWAMTAAPSMHVNGPYRVGGSATSAPA